MWVLRAKLPADVQLPPKVVFTLHGVSLDATLLSQEHLKLTAALEIEHEDRDSGVRRHIVSGPVGFFPLSISRVFEMKYPFVLSGGRVLARLRVPDGAPPAPNDLTLQVLLHGSVEASVL